MKRAKGNAKKNKPNPKQNNIPKKATAVSEERKCPVEGCDSMGHLGGRFEKHFTQEACPLYHNISLGDTKAFATEREQHEELRRKALTLFDPSKKVSTVEQKAYQLKIRDIRAKFKPIMPSPSRNAHIQNAAQQIEKEREPNLNGLVTDYDLQLFRQAQAKASEEMEKELLTFSPDKGTK